MKVEFVTPRVPNFIKVKIGEEEVMQPLTAFSDLELRDIAERWKIDLFKNKSRQSKESKK